MFSQKDEERVILQLSGNSGKFLDIGAWDGETFSNTRALALKGWSGVLVEPSRVPFQKITELYRADDGRIIAVNAAVGLERGDVILYESEDAVSTTQPGHYERWKAHAKFTGRRKVKQITVPDLVSQFGPFQFVSIDTEGTSVDLFKTLDLINMKPRAVCVEYDGRLQEVVDWAAVRGYSVAHTTNENVILKCGQ